MPESHTHTWTDPTVHLSLEDQILLFDADCVDPAEYGVDTLDDLGRNFPEPRGMLFHIGCTGRSGSVFAHRMLTQMGVRSLHEKASERPFYGKPLKWVEQNPLVFQRYEGTIGWAWDVGCPELVNRATYKLFMVRDPLDFLRSAVTHDDGIFTRVESCIGTEYVRGSEDPSLVKLSRAVNYWLGYLKNYGQDRPVLQVETFRHGGELLIRFCEIVGLPKEITALAVPPEKPVNSRDTFRTYEAGAAVKLKNAFPDLYDALMQARAEVGYMA